MWRQPWATQTLLGAHVLLLEQGITIQVGDFNNSYIQTYIIKPLLSASLVHVHGRSSPQSLGLAGWYAIPVRASGTIQ